MNLNIYKIKINKKLKIKYMKKLSIQKEWNKLLYRYFDVSKYYG